MNKFFQLVLVFFITGSLWGQYNPNTNWETIKTDHFNFIFDSKISEDAKNIASDMENLFASLTNGMGGTVDRYTVVLPAQMIESNGYVSPINNKSVFYPVPPVTPFSGTEEWYDLLSIHETRHMVQFSHVRNSILQQILKLFFGSNGIAGAALIPSYFYEGDAVLTETLLSNSGRGRSPGFERALRTILLNNKDYTFAKAFHGSKNDFNPNQYVLGYYLMTYLKKEYGSDVLERIVTKAANNPFPMNFSAATNAITGKTIVSIYKETMAELKELWSKQDEQVIPTETKLISMSKKDNYSNLKYPVVTSNGDLLYLERGLGNKQVLIRETIGNVGKKEEHIAILGSFSEFHSNVIYSRTSRDPRWIYTGYSDIYRYNLDTKTTTLLTNKQRYFNPVYSKDGSKIATIEVSESRVVSIVLLDSNTGDLINKIEIKNIDIISGLSWGADDDTIVISAIEKHGSFIGLLDLKSDKLKYLTKIDNIEKTLPVFYKNSILFVSSYSGIDNIHIIDIETEKESQIISSRFGLNYPSVKDDTLYFSIYDIDGYSVHSLDLKSVNKKQIDELKQSHVDYFEPLLEESFPTEHNIYNSKKYNPYLNLIDIHSWLINPIFPSLEESEIFNSETDIAFDTMEILLFSEDELENMEMLLYSHYKISDGAWDIGSEGTFRGLYPVLEWNINCYNDGLKPNVSTLKSSVAVYLPLTISQDYNSITYSLGINPFTYQDYRYNYSYNKLYYFFGLSLVNISGFELGTRLLFGHGLDHKNNTTLGLVSTSTVPTFIRDQSISLKSEQKYNIDRNRSINSSEITLAKNSLLELPTIDSSFISYQSFEYQIPLLYPEISLLNWFYLTDFTISLGYESIFSTDFNYNSLALGEISMGYFILRIPAQFETSFSYFYNIEDSSTDFIINPISFKYGLN